MPESEKIEEFGKDVVFCLLPESPGAVKAATDITMQLHNALPSLSAKVLARAARSIREFACYHITQTEYQEQMIENLSAEAVEILNSIVRKRAKLYTAAEQGMLPTFTVIHPQSAPQPPQQVRLTYSAQPNPPSYLQPRSHQFVHPYSGSSSSWSSSSPTGTVLTEAGRNLQTQAFPSPSSSPSPPHPSSSHSPSPPPPFRFQPSTCFPTSKRSNITIVDMTSSPETTLGWAQARRMRKKYSHSAAITGTTGARGGVGGVGEVGAGVAERDMYIVSGPQKASMTQNYAAGQERGPRGSPLPT